MIKEFKLEDFYTNNMTATAQILLINHINNINKLVRYYNVYHDERTLHDIKMMTPKSFKKNIDNLF